MAQDVPLSSESASEGSGRKDEYPADENRIVGLIVSFADNMRINQVRILLRAELDAAISDTLFNKHQNDVVGKKHCSARQCIPVSLVRFFL
ncbi:TPA: hypothetical protein JLT79_001282 [Escherichia coli]|uniref:hypothetical protein n=1 Tax=Klebsiella michiganensis TaxID=1134687 RepID=UPI0013A58E87|nr:hypothetical protein [Klebsiella michiganensis]HAW3655333.1 hypothetical protein [Escherichia coli]